MQEPGHRSGRDDLSGINAGEIQSVARSASQRSDLGTRCERQGAMRSGKTGRAWLKQHEIGGRKPRTPGPAGSSPPASTINSTYEAHWTGLADVVAPKVQ